jgi:C2H2 type zinc finger protein
MAETCAFCAGSFASPAELIAHQRKAHPGRDARESLATNPESGIPGYVCSLCGRRFWSASALRHHNLSPHPRSALPSAPFTPYSVRYC